MAKANRSRGKATATAVLQADALSGDLGELGTDKGVLDITFGWFGRQLRVNPGAGELELMEFLTEAEDIAVGEDDASLAASVPAMKAVFKFLRAQIHPDDWAVFYDLAKTHQQNTLDLMNVAMAIVHKVAGFPTGPSADSGPGTASTKPRSKGGSSSPGSAQSSLTARALALVPPTRPDLAAAYIQAAEERALAGR